MKKLFLPNYNKSILNVANSILHYYGIETIHNALPVIDNELKKNYKNIVFFILDGLGKSTLENSLLKNDFLQQNCVDTITSVFPASTMSAKSTLVSGMSPLEHGRLGVNYYFKNENVRVNLFTNKNLETKQIVENFNFLDKYFPAPNLDKQINLKKINGLNTHNLMPSKIDNINGYEAIENMVDKISEISQKDGQNFVLAYWDEPDNISHKYGPYSDEVKNFVKNVNDYMGETFKDLKDTLIIITADHGQVEITEEIILDDCDEFLSCLSQDPFFGERCRSFNVKPEKEQEFLQIFKRDFSNDFTLISKAEFMKMQLLGEAKKEHELAYSLIGDYIAIATGNKLFKFCGSNEKARFKIKKGQHAGLTAEEVEVPLILIANQ